MRTSEIRRDTGRTPVRYCECKSHRGVKSGTRFAIYKCNKYPVRFFRDTPSPKTVLTLNELPYILGVEGVIMPKIYEYNPDTNTVRERERVKMKEKDMIAMMMEDNQSDHINPDREPSPYRNEFAEAVEILKRMNDKLDTLLEQQQEHLERGHPTDDGK